MFDIIDARYNHEDLQESWREERTIKMNFVMNRRYECITVSDRVLFLDFFELANEIYSNV